MPSSQSLVAIEAWMTMRKLMMMKLIVIDCNHQNEALRRHLLHKSWTDGLIMYITMIAMKWRIWAKARVRKWKVKEDKIGIVIHFFIQSSSHHISIIIVHWLSNFVRVIMMNGFILAMNLLLLALVVPQGIPLIIAVCYDICVLLDSFILGVAEFRPWKAFWSFSFSYSSSPLLSAFDVFAMH